MKKQDKNKALQARSDVKSRNSVKSPEQSTIYRPTSDCWHPNFPDGTVSLSFIELSTGQWRVCVWGADDDGMERDFKHGDRQKAKKLYNRLAECSDITKEICQELGMVPA